MSGEPLVAADPGRYVFAVGLTWLITGGCASSRSDS